MNRPICVLTIIVIFIIIGLHFCGVVFFDYDKVYELDGASMDFEGLILGKKSETDYKTTYIIKIKQINKIQNKYTQTDNSQNNKITKKEDNSQNSRTGITNENKQKENEQTVVNQIFKGKKFLLDVKKKDYSKELEYGDCIAFNATYNKPNGQRNYGGYDYSLYLKTQNIYGTFEGSQIELKSKNKGSFIGKGIISFKEYIKSILKANLDENEAELCIGLVIGDRTNLAEDIQADFKTSNLTHMLAVSGSHFVYIILAVTYINKFLKRKRIGQILMLIVIVLFMNLTGNTGSVVRSGIMASLGVVASIIHRKSDIWNNMAIAMLIQIILNPYIIFDVGVQLSYGGVIGIVAFNKVVTNFMEQLSNKFKDSIKVKNKKNENIKLPNNNSICNEANINENNNRRKEIANKSWNIGESICNYIKESISVTISANIVIIPIMMYTFNTISLSFVISNLLAGAILGIIVLYAFALIFLYMILHNLISPLFIILNLMLKLLIYIAHCCSLIPFSKIYVVTPNIVLIILLYIMLYLKNSEDFLQKIVSKLNKFIAKITNWANIHSKDTSMVIFKRFTLICLIVVIVANFTFPIMASKRNNLEVNFIDVGQGDSTLIRVSNKTILIDGGGSSYGETFDVGEMTLFPYLLDRGIRTIDYVIVSHFDSDHCQGLNFVLENMKVKNAIISSLGQKSSEYETFLNLAKKQNTNLIYVKKGDTIKIGKSIIKILFPDNEPITDNEKNNNALVFKFMWKNISILFTGDIEEKAENKILNLYEDDSEELRATILKVAHHGSKTSSTKQFLEAVNPKIALIGVGEDNNFGHPNSGVLDRIDGLGCKIYRTDKCGEISIRFDKQVKVKTMI